MSEAGGSAAAFEALASGGLAADEARAWALLQEAWPELYGGVQALLRAARLREDLREDCGQAVLVRVWRFRSSYRGASAAALAAWMNRITRNELARATTRARRAEARVGVDPKALESVPDRRTTPAEQVGAAEDLRALESCLDELEARLREVVELLYAETPLSEREAVEVLGVSKSHVHTLRRRALEALARCLAGKGVG